MHIQNIHSMIEKLSECAKCELDKGIENIDTKEMSEVAEMIKELCEAEYLATITKTMKEYDFDNAEEIMQEGRRGYRGRMRDSKGRYMYTEPMNYVPEMYRDMDRADGKMYYTSANRSQGISEGGTRNYGGESYNRDMREGRNGMSRKTYVETKEMHKGNAPEDKQAKQRELDKWMNDFTADVKELVGDMTNEEKTLLKTRLNNLQASL